MSKYVWRSAAIATSVLITMSAATLTAKAGAATAAKMLTDETNTAIVKVGTYKYKKYRKRRSNRYYRNGHVHAPFTHVEAHRGRVVVDAPYAHVKKSYRGVHVRAPYVNLYIPY